MGIFGYSFFVRGFGRAFAGECAFSAAAVASVQVRERERRKSKQTQKQQTLHREKHFWTLAFFGEMSRRYLMKGARTVLAQKRERERNRMEEPFQSRSSSTWPGAWLSGSDSPPWPLLCCRSSSSGHVTSLHCSTLLCLQRTPNSCPPSNFCFCCDTEITESGCALPSTFSPPPPNHCDTHPQPRERGF